MFNPGDLTLGQLSSAVRDFGIVGALVVFGWKGRSWIQPLVNMFDRTNKFFDRADTHMTTMENQMHLLLNNHLAHLKSEQAESLAHIEKTYASRIESTANSDGNSGTPSGRIA